MEKYRIGVDVGGTKVAYGLFGPDGGLVARRQHPTDTALSASAFSDGVIEQIGLLLREQSVSPGELGGVGIGVPSYMLYGQGVIIKTANMPNLRNFPARDYFSAALEVPVAVDNDVHAAALAEHRRGAGQGLRHMLYCTVSTGISSGIIIDGKLFRGSYGAAGETGHMIANIDGGGAPCMCGNAGCYESNISGSKITKLAADRIRAGEKSLLTELCGGDLDSLSAKHIEDAFLQGDALADWALEHMSRYMGMWVFNLFQALNINTYVFGGGMVRFGDMLFGRVRKVFDSYYRYSDLPVEFRFARLGNDCGIIGAAELLVEG